MTDLQHRHLITMTLTVDFTGMAGIGQTPASLRRIALVAGNQTATGPVYSIFEVG